MIIAGSRDINDYNLLRKAITDSGFDITEIVSGGANGVDKLGERYGQEHGFPVTRFLPDWKSYGRSAGLRRNEEMVGYAQAAVVLWDGSSRGSQHLMATAKAHSLPLHVMLVAEE